MKSLGYKLTDEIENEFILKSDKIYLLFDTGDNLEYILTAYIN